MKAKHLKKLRGICKHYEVSASSHLFGFYAFDHYETKIIVLAKSHENACERALRRGYGLEHEGHTIEQTTVKFGHWKVKIVGASDHFRNVLYF